MQINCMITFNRSKYLNTQLQLLVQICKGELMLYVHLSSMILLEALLLSECHSLEAIDERDFDWLIDFLDHRD